MKESNLWLGREWKSLSHVWLCDPMYYTVYGILQARLLELIAVPFSWGSSQPRDWTQVSHIAGGFFTSWATREAQWKIWLQTQAWASYFLQKRADQYFLPFMQAFSQAIPHKGGSFGLPNW